MKIDIILAGVGGQGILSIASVIAEAALNNGLYMKQAEVHGMSQRGGDVQSNLRISDQPIHSDLIPKGAADVIISLEPMEALRYLPYLKEDGMVVTNVTTFENIPDYPNKASLLDTVGQLPRKVMIDADTVAKEVGSARTANMVLLGASTSFLNAIDYAMIEQAIRSVFGRKGEEIIQLNLKALAAGKEMADKTN